MFKISCQTLAVAALLSANAQVDAQAINDIAQEQNHRYLEGDNASTTGTTTGAGTTGSGTATGAGATGSGTVTASGTGTTGAGTTGSGTVTASGTGTAAGAGTTGSGTAAGAGTTGAGTTGTGTTGTGTTGTGTTGTGTTGTGTAAGTATVVTPPTPPDCSLFKLVAKSKDTQSKTWPYDYDDAEKKNVVFTDWTEAFDVSPLACATKETSIPKECKSYAGDCAGEGGVTLEKPWLYEIAQTDDGILFNKHCYECITESGQKAQSKVIIQQKANCKETLTLTANAALKTTNPLPEKKDAEEGNDGEKSKETTTDTTGGGTAAGGGTTDTTGGGTAAGGGTTDTTGGRRLEGTGTGDAAGAGATDGAGAGADDKAPTTNPDDYYLPIQAYSDNDKPVIFLDAVSFFFKNSKSATCGISKCELLLPGCEKPYVGDKLSIQSEYPYTLSAMLNIEGGYQDKFCFKCENDKSTVSQDNLVFTQPHQCVSALSPSSVYSFKAPVKDYNPLSIPHMYSPTWSRFFDQKWADKCPMKKCQLLKKTSVGDTHTYAALEAAEATVLTVGPAPDYALYQSLMIAKGYNYEVSMECDNGFQKIYHDLSIKQLSKCKTALSLKKDVDPALLKGFKIPYSTTMRHIVPTAWNEDIFETIDSDNCPITGCARYLPGCNTPITGITNMMFQTNDGKIQLNVNANANKGWKTHICVVCTNGEQDISQDHYVGEQGNVCAFGFDVIKDPLPATITTFDYDDSAGSNRKIGTGYTSFFKVKSAVMGQNCALQNENACVLFEKDCKTKYTGENVSMTQSLPYQITSTSKKWEGFKEELCLQCITSQKIGNTQVLGAQTLETFINIEQKSKCLTQLVPADIPLGPKVLINHDSPSYNKNIGVGYTSFFKNLDKDHCPVTSCELLEKDCKTPYTGLALKMSKTFPFNLEVGEKAVTNKDEPSCIKCGNGFVDATYDKMIITQTGSCLDVLTQKVINKATFGDLKLMWQPKPTLIEIANAELFFKNSKESICPMTKCTLLNADCKTKNTNKNFIMSEVWPYKITTDQQSILGYNDTVCLECMIDDQRTVAKPFYLNQYSKCLTTLKASTKAFKYKYIDFNPMTDGSDNILGVDYKSFFTNTDTVNCPVTNCKVLQKGCLAPFAQTQVNHFSLIDSKDFRLKAAQNYVEGWDSEMCLQCENAFMKATYDGIGATQKMMPKESKMIWVIMGIIVVVVALMLIGCIWFINHHDHKKEETYRSKYLQARLEQIAQGHGELQRTQSVYISHKEQFNELQEAIALHPDFQEGGRYTRGATIVAKSGGLGGFAGYQGGATKGKPDQMELPDLMPNMPNSATANSKQALVYQDSFRSDQTPVNAQNNGGFQVDHQAIDIGVLSSAQGTVNVQDPKGVTLQGGAQQVDLNGMAFDSAVGSGVQLVNKSIDRSEEFDNAQNDQALQITKNQSEMPPAMNNNVKLQAQQRMGNTKSVIMTNIQNNLAGSMVSTFKERMAVIKQERQKSVFIQTKQVESMVSMDDQHFEESEDSKEIDK